MNHGYSVLGFIVIVILYVAIGLMAAGAISMVRKILVPRAEQIFYAMFLIVIALFLPSIYRLLRSGDRMAAGTGCGRGLLCVPASWNDRSGAYAY